MVRTRSSTCAATADPGSRIDRADDHDRSPETAACHDTVRGTATRTVSRPASRPPGQLLLGASKLSESQVQVTPDSAARWAMSSPPRPPAPDHCYSEPRSHMGTFVEHEWIPPLNLIPLVLEPGRSPAPRNRTSMPTPSSTTFVIATQRHPAEQVRACVTPLRALRPCPPVTWTQRPCDLSCPVSHAYFRRTGQ